MSWLSDLSRQISQCSDTSGDSKALEERQAKIQVILILN